MNRMILRALNTPLLLLMVMLGIALQTSLFYSYPLLYLQPDIVLLAVIWCGLRRTFLEGGILTLILGNIAEIHSGVPQGIFLTSYMIIYLAIRGFAQVALIPRLSTLILITLISSVAWKLLNLGMLHFLDLSANQWKHTIALIFPGAVMQGIIGVWVYRFLERYDWVTYKDPRARQMMEDELQLNDEWL
jgi:hypothetical protein